MSFQDNPYQFLPQPPEYEAPEYEGDFLQAILGVPDPQVRTKSAIQGILNTEQSAVGLVTIHDDTTAVIYSHTSVRRRVIVNGVRTTIQDHIVGLYVPSEIDGKNVIGSVTTYLSSLP